MDRRSFGHCAAWAFLSAVPAGRVLAQAGGGGGGGGDGGDGADAERDGRTYGGHGGPILETERALRIEGERERIIYLLFLTRAESVHGYEIRGPLPSASGAGVPEGVKARFKGARLLGPVRVTENALVVTDVAQVPQHARTTVAQNTDTWEVRRNLTRFSEFPELTQARAARMRVIGQAYIKGNEVILQIGKQFAF